MIACYQSIRQAYFISLGYIFSSRLTRRIRGRYCADFQFSKFIWSIYYSLKLFSFFSLINLHFYNQTWGLWLFTGVHTYIIYTINLVDRCTRLILTELQWWIFVVELKYHTHTSQCVYIRSRIEVLHTHISVCVYIYILTTTV